MKGLPIFLIFAVVLSYMSFAQQPECDYKVEILVDGDEFNAEDFTWRMKATKIQGPSTNITGTAKIEDSDGKSVKSYKPWTSDSISKQKTSSEYSPNLKPDEYKLTAEIAIDCDDTDKDNNIDSKTIKIKGEKPEPKPKEETKQSTKTKTATAKKITKASDEELETEEPEETETELKTEAPKATPKQKSEEFDNVIQLTSSKKNQKPQIQASAVQQPLTIYESSSEKAGGLIMIFLLTLSILFNIVLIWRR